MSITNNKSAIDLAAKHSNTNLVAELNSSQAEGDAPPIIIASDGTPDGTHLFVHGKSVLFKRMDMYCNTEGDYRNCSISITMDESDSDGITVEKTLTLRKEISPEDIK